MPDPQDLVTVDQLTATLAAGGLTLTAAQLAAAPALVTAASYEICRYCRRWFAVNTYDEVKAPYQGQVDKGEPAWVDLKAIPLVAGGVTRCATGRAPAVLIANTAAAANQRALVEFTATGDPSIGLTRTGVKLTRVASGVATASTLTFAANVTVNALAAAVNALSGGWSAAVQGAYGLWASADLYGPVGPSSVLGNAGATLDLFGDDLTGADVDLAGGRVFLPPARGSTSYAWPSGPGPDGGVLYGASGWLSPVRVTYQAGFATIPYPVQLAAISTVKSVLHQLATDTSLKSEKAQDYAWEAREAVKGLPFEVLRDLSSYRMA